VVYEELVHSPEPQLERVFAYLGLEHDPSVVEYGRAGRAKKGMGDPMTVDRVGRPVTDSVEGWAADLASDAEKRAFAERMLARLEAPDLAIWQWPPECIWAPVEAAGGRAPRKRIRNAYTFQRRVMLALKKDIHERPHGKLVKRIKYYCDVLLRE
jgi:hypothetical protein